MNLCKSRGFSAAAVLACAMLILCACALTGCGSTETQKSADSSQKIKVTASFYPMYDFVKKVGGDRVEVTNLVPAGTEPHDWEPTSKDIAEIGSSKLFVYNGAGMEHWVKDALDSLKGTGVEAVEASYNTHLIKGHAHTHEAEEAHDHDAHKDHDGDEHEASEYDPHVWLSPENAKIEMANIKDALIKVDPDGQKTYEENYARASAELDELNKSYKDELSKVKRHEIVVSHEAFGYICADYGLTQVPIEGMEADAEPDAHTLAEITDYVKNNGVTTIFTEELVSPKIAESIASETGAKVEQLNPIEGLTDEQLKAGDDYMSIMKENLKKLVGALS